MTASAKNENIDTMFAHLYDVISSQRFLAMEGLGKEVPFFICPFHPANQEKVDSWVKALCSRLENNGINVIEVNLYDLCIEKLGEEGDLELILEKESSWTKNELKEQLQALLDVAEEIVPAIQEKIPAQGYDVLFLTGVGLVFPYIRSHNILNNLQRVTADRPLVMFFPGDYTHSLEHGSSLDLFGRLQDDKYYRAFNINHYQI